jgi:hypothetical protein
MAEHTKNSLKCRINNIYRNYLILNYYESGLLKNSLPSEENLKKLEETKKTIIHSTNQQINEVAKITEKQFEITEYIEPLKAISDLLNSEYFYEIENNMHQILKTYEQQIIHLIEDFNISPIDQMKLSKIDFV